ncbi:tRNA (adenosine(37)-N6)-threonylcarbamoyltransferase complex dimerization subunit type 1 TsaB [Streptococcus caprae]|uniref:tRNA (Adenosine(37)-N6)-threonylcarbamoyltransferase complex dimerization subunit type 1 TsaB n=1 Tax=Streptococcus caprae TaxID=1640501 RepID=A0ABV8CTW3_9STRE
MNILSFDTSSQALTVAILRDEQVLADLTLNIKKNHSISLMPSIDFLMGQLGMDPQDLDRIVVAQGPGSYTGLRVAVATAKTLAYSLNISLVGVSSLQAIALNVAFDGLVVPLMDARRNNAYVGFYEDGRAVQPDRHDSLDAILVACQDRAKLAFVGEVSNFRDQILEAFPQALVQEVLPSAVAMGRLGLQEEPHEVHSFVPEYLKKVEAEENWLKTHEEGSSDYIKRV